MLQYMKEIRILGLNIFDRIKEAGQVQKTLSQYGHCIKTRYGFHEVSEDICSRTGFILLELAGKPEEWNKLETELKLIGGIEIKNMKFN
jgi:hypothetical protein